MKVDPSEIVFLKYCWPSGWLQILFVFEICLNSTSLELLIDVILSSTNASFKVVLRSYNRFCVLNKDDAEIILNFLICGMVGWVVGLWACVYLHNIEGVLR
jgi:cell division protein FtsX